tara:strand:+ start:126 stop:629 length:504 start_codon:yes stop_codon:yes gene_type:complete
MGGCFKPFQSFNGYVHPRGLSLEREGSNSQDNGSRLTSLTGKFVSRSCANTPTEPREQNDQFGGLQQSVCQGVQASHALFSKGWQCCATHAVEGMSESKNMNVFSGLEAGIVGIDQHQMSASLTLLMGSMGPRATDASHSSNENVGWVHGCSVRGISMNFGVLIQSM